MRYDGWELDVDAVDVLRITVQQRKARKEHSCYICSSPIRKGEHYSRIVERVDGGMVVHKVGEHQHSHEEVS